MTGWFSRLWPTEDRATVLVTNQIGRRRALTPEGYLLCEDVRLARLGELHYRPEELPIITPGDRPYLVITRDASVLFAPDTIASFEGKSVTNEHPPRLLDPEISRQYSVGTIMNVRRGEGPDAQFLMGELLITDADAISDVLENNKTEISLGYRAEYEEVNPGYGRQTKIQGNHAALVIRGRNGPVCAIQDSGEPDMSKPSLRERIRKAFTTRDAAALEQELQAVPEVAQEETSTDEDEPDPIQMILDRLSSIEQRLSEHNDSMKAMRDEFAPKKMDKDDSEQEEAKDEYEDKDDDKDDSEKEETKDKYEDKDKDDSEKEETMDAAAVMARRLEIFAAAEVLSPGIRLPTINPTRVQETCDALLQLQRDALSAALKHQDRGRLIAPILGPRAKNPATIPVMDLDTVFRASAEVVKAANRMSVTKDSNRVPVSMVTGRAPSATDLQSIIATRREALGLSPSGPKR